MKLCPHCGKNIVLKIYDPKEYRRRKVANAKSSLKKAKDNGTKMGRPKLRDDDKIKMLRSQGHSIRSIAFLCGVSTAAVQRGLK